MRFMMSLVMTLALTGVCPVTASAQQRVSQVVQQMPARLWGERYEGSVTAEEWDDFASSFVRSNGRVRDTGNADISHSEGQGYGMFLAWMAGAAGDFDRIWHFTRTEMQIRDDGLVSWTWQEGRRPHVTDVNNATDGDIFIAYALLMAGKTWNRPDLYTAGLDLVHSIRRYLIAQHPEFGPVVMPGRFGFDGEDVLINPSYWVDEAFLTFADADPTGPWMGLVHSGEGITIAAGRISGSGLPPDWVVLPNTGGVGRPQDKISVFGYNAIRVPLYRIRAGRMASPQIVEMVRQNGIFVLPPQKEGGSNTSLTDIGYRQLAALVDCASGRGRVAISSSSSFVYEDYYPSALRLFSLSAVRALYPQCLPGRR